MIPTMTWDGDSLTLLDQTQLPTAIAEIECHTMERVREAIARLEVRGAPAIGVSAAFGMVLASREAQCSDDYLGTLQTMSQRLESERPTAVNLSWAVRMQMKLATEAYQNARDPIDITELLEAQAIRLYDEDIAINQAMGQHGANAIGPVSKVLTHCNAGALACCGWGTALGVVRELHRRGSLKMVYSDETRPLLQGARLTAWELSEDRIPVTVITDGMAAWTMQQKGIEAVIVGADRIALNGDTANKIGTFGVALAARALNIPFYVAAPISTFDFTLENGSMIPIEERNPDEVRRFRSETTAPDKAAVFNPSFDVTPCGLITGIITEKGVLRPPFKQAIAALRKSL